MNVILASWAGDVIDLTDDRGLLQVGHRGLGHQHIKTVWRNVGLPKQHRILMYFVGVFEVVQLGKKARLRSSTRCKASHKDIVLVK